MKNQVAFLSDATDHFLKHPQMNYQYTRPVSDPDPCVYALLVSPLFPLC